MEGVTAMSNQESSTADLQVLSNQVPNLSRGMSLIPSLYSKSLGIGDPEITSLRLRVAFKTSERMRVLREQLT